MDRASGTEMVDSRSIPGRSNQRLKLVFTASLFDLQYQKGTVLSLHRGYQPVDIRGLSRRPKDLFATS